MRRNLLGLVLAAVLLSGCSLGNKKSGIEIMSYPNAKVFIDGKEAGTTPYKNNSLKPGEVEIKLTSGGTEWIKKLRLENGANTVISREFGKDETTSGGYILYFESTGDKNKAGFLTSTRPDRSTVKIEDEVKGLSPLKIDNVGEGDKKLTISYPGYKSLNSYVKFINGYQLVAEADLAKEEVIIRAEIDDQSGTAPAGTASALTNTTMVTIKSTETGWLRVRNTASASGAEVARVKPGEKYKLLGEKDGWYQIDLGNSKNGWISATYAEKSGQ
jgi:hypothetical protein